MYFFGVALDYVASTWKDLGRPMVVLRMRANYTDGMSGGGPLAGAGVRKGRDTFVWGDLCSLSLFCFMNESLNEF